MPGWPSPVKAIDSSSIDILSRKSPAMKTGYLLGVKGAARMRPVCVGPRRFKSCSRRLPVPSFLDESDKVSRPFEGKAPNCK